MAKLMNVIPKYTGNQTDDIHLWFKRIKTVQETNEEEKKPSLALIGKLEGRALEWFHLKPEFAAMSWVEFKEIMFKIYKKKDNTAYERISTTKVNKGIGLEEADIISYVIDGMDNTNLQMQAQFNFGTKIKKTYPLLLKVFN
ncbi:unnamed protein product [Brassicogethes aeneus]|uniref:Retrotransposon gag domain-containing protein n=1 Tax=Brassicogethes aeneus TaxID=1431903 RepID=A0A9P0BFY9_BRAAE|nr:unnamed protein product [Brassicogethes aeneus]